MSLLDRIAVCRKWQPANYRPFLVGGRRVGRIPLDLIPKLERFDKVLEIGADTVRIKDSFSDFDSRSGALHEVLVALRDEGSLRRLRGEYYAVLPVWGEAPLMKIDRAAAPLFGVRGYGVHLSGYVRKSDGIYLWVGRRARDKATAPGKLDHLVAGGQPYGLTPAENLVKEAAEEANVQAELAGLAIPVGVISYITEQPDGLRDDMLFCYDLELPEDFVPSNTDGEVEEFFLWPAARVLEALETSDAFKFNVALVNIDFMIRHGIIGPERPDYVALIHGLRLPHCSNEPQPA